MKWIKIENGCEMPRSFECVIACHGNAENRIWEEAYFYEPGRFESASADIRIPEVTHWARVELPEE